MLNPFGVLLLLILLPLPFWIVYDMFFRKRTLYDFWKKIESVLSKKWILVGLFIIFLSNWFWNIYKGL